MFCKPHSGRATAQFESLQEREVAERREHLIVLAK